jgi:gamma-glutamyltranspeptidase/glutathione hydrolase
VASDDARGTAAGLEVLAAGGNAVDAAVATALALAVAFPEAGNLGGGGFAVVRMAGNGGPEVASLDFREEAPAAATRGMYLDEHGDPIPEASLVGPLAAGVPGSPTGLWELHRRFGKLPWAQVVSPAERLAASGFTVDANLHRQLEKDRDLLARFPESAARWLPGGEVPAVGTVIREPDLAATLHAYAERGPEAITRGEVAERILAVSRRQGGVLTAADLAGYRPVWRRPVTFDAFGWHVATMGLPSSGGAILGEVFGILERRGWAALPRFGADRAHLLVEAFRRAFADRFLLGDPTTSRVTEAQVLSASWLDRRAAGIEPAHATDSKSLAAPAGPPPRESRDTTHLVVMDGDGNVVSLTTTLNALFGCKSWVPGFGFLNDEMDDFAAAPGRPNLYGLVQGEANAVRPGKRMLSSMSPTIAWRETAADNGENGPGGEEILALGGRGGSKIPTNVAQVLLDVMVDGDALQAALDRPRVHHQWLPDRLEAEPDALSPETRAALETRGHHIEITPDTAEVNAAMRLPDGSEEAAVDPRGPGQAAVAHPER